MTNIILQLLAIFAASGLIKIDILSSYHLKKAVIRAEESEDTLQVKQNKLLVNGAFLDTYTLETKGFTVEWKAKSRNYDGWLKARVHDGELLLLNSVDKTNYLASVVGAEMLPNAGIEALKAQAVLARTFIYEKRKRHEREAWDVCDLTHCQSYRGRQTVSSASLKAVKETEGMILTYHNKPCRIFYHSTSGGSTANAAFIWPDECAPYLISVQDSFCKKSPHYRWERNIPAHKIAQVLGFEGISDLKVLSTYPDGRVKEIAVKYRQEKRVFGGWNFRMLVCQKLGWNSLKSSWFKVERVGKVYVFKGRGLGHGVGLSQWGAKGMADAGYDYREILTYYYPGTEVQKW